MTTEDNCLSSGQVTVCTKEEGVSFLVKFPFGRTEEKIIPYSDITDIKIGPKWWIFPGFRIITKNENKIFIQARAYTGFNFKNNQVTFPFWQFKKWENLVSIIKEKIG